MRWRERRVTSEAGAAGAEPGFEYDRSVIGVDTELGSVQVTREQIAAYCQSVGETNPLYTDEEVATAGPYGGLVAPPGMLSALPFGFGGPDPKVKFGNTVFMAGTRLELDAPIRPGDTVTATTQVKEVFQKTGRSGTMVFVVRRTTYTNQDGERVAAMEQSQVHREV